MNVINIIYSPDSLSEKQANIFLFEPQFIFEHPFLVYSSTL